MNIKYSSDPWSSLNPLTSGFGVAIPSDLVILCGEPMLGCATTAHLSAIAGWPRREARHDT